jgi:hypothetical protein
MSDDTPTSGTPPSDSYFSQFYNDAANAATNAYTKAKNLVNPPQPPPAGGRRRRRSSKKRYYGGKFHANTPLNGIASSASPISGIQHTAKANYVGGRRRKRKSCRRRHSHTRQCKH